MFEYEGLFYQQIRGLAMGNRLSGTLAIICMDRLERKFVYSLKPKPIFYVRYVDDVGTLVPDEESAVKMLNYLNSKHPTIQFEMELPDTEGFLPILDIKMKIGVDGRGGTKTVLQSGEQRIDVELQFAPSALYQERHRKERNSTRNPLLNQGTRTICNRRRTLKVIEKRLPGKRTQTT